MMSSLPTRSDSGFSSTMWSGVIPLVCMSAPSCLCMPMVVNPTSTPPGSGIFVVDPRDPVVGTPKKMMSGLIAFNTVAAYSPYAIVSSLTSATICSAPMMAALDGGWLSAGGEAASLSARPTGIAGTHICCALMRSGPSISPFMSDGRISGTSEVATCVTCEAKCGASLKMAPLV